MKSYKNLIIILFLIFIGSYFFLAKKQNYEYKKRALYLINYVERYKKNNGVLPNHINDTTMNDGPYYEKINDTLYKIYFAVDFDTYYTYTSDKKKWKYTIR